jgi:hypothetical protein
MMQRAILAAAAMLALATGSAFAASDANSVSAMSAQSVVPQTTMTFAQTNSGGRQSIYQPSVAGPGETRHVIGGETFYYSPDMNPGGGDGA